MLKILKCGTNSLQNSAMTVAIIDVICTSILLILFVLGSSLMLAFAIIGKSHNATRVLDIVTDDVFGQVQATYDNIREKKDVAEDMGVWLIIMFLTIVDFIISCIFLDGVKNKCANKCQIWLNIRIIIIFVFKIVVLINLIYGTNWIQAIPDMIFTIYRVLGLYIGYQYLQELNSSPENEEQKQKNCGKHKGEKKGKGEMPIIAISDMDGNNGERNLSQCSGNSSEYSGSGIMMNLTTLSDGNSPIGNTLAPSPNTPKRKHKIPQATLEEFKV